MLKESGNLEKTTIEIPDGYKIIKEGYGSIIYQNKNEVFYNNAQVVNRDISTLVIQEYSNEQKNKIKILEALSATGLRSIRYWKEIKGINQIITNDISKEAFESITRNVKHNEICEKTQVIPNMADANIYMINCAAKGELFDVIDLDPYGSAMPFLYSSLQAIKDGGLLCVTCTDMAVLTGTQSETCFAKYGAFPVKQKYCHEYAIRTLLSCIQQTASKLKKYIVPHVCCFIDFYVRVFVKVFVSAKIVKGIYSKFGYIFQCTHCPAYYNYPIGKKDQKRVKYPNSECTECNQRVIFGGPIWIDGIQNFEFLKNLLARLNNDKVHFAEYKRINGMIKIMSLELPDIPLFYSLSTICKVLRCPSPKFKIVKAALINMGYRFSETHCAPNSLKTDAPPEVVLDIFREFVKTQKDFVLATKPPIVKTIMSKEIKYVDQFHIYLHYFDTRSKVDFTIHDNNQVNRGFSLHFPKPKFWGPKSRATGNTTVSQTNWENNVGDKRKRNDKNDKNDKNPIEPVNKKQKEQNIEGK